MFAKKFLFALSAFSIAFSHSTNVDAKLIAGPGTKLHIFTQEEIAAESLRVKNTSNEVLAVEFREDGPSWEASKLIGKLGIGKNTTAPLWLHNQNIESIQLWVRYLKGNDPWTTPKKMQAINGSITLP